VSSHAPSVLDNPGYHSLAGAHAKFARVSGRARRYEPEVSVFAGVPDDATAEDWAALVALLAPGEALAISGRPLPEGFAEGGLPAGWVANVGAGLQMTDDDFAVQPGDGEGLIALGAADVPDMLELIAIAQPGPFAPRTVELGGYLGIRIDGRLAAMAGRRVNPESWVEVSAVATHPDFRGQGLAARVVRGVVAAIRAEGRRAFLHSNPANETAVNLYRRLGFVVRKEVPFAFIFEATDELDADAAAAASGAETAETAEVAA
jgi:ribosomal protein S18 acetylase RimI-like enzyme